MKKQFVKLVVVALTGATMALNMSCKDDDKKDDPAVAPTLSVTPDTDVVFKSDGSNAFTIAVETNQSEWDVKPSNPWVKVEKNEAAKTFVLSAAPTVYTDPKIATVTVSAGKAQSVTINVTQQAGAYVNITNEVLVSYEAPFPKKPEIKSWDRFYEILDWEFNESAGMVGLVYNDGSTIDEFFLWCFDFVAGGPMLNGKVCQTKQLEAGAYRFDAYTKESKNNDAANYWGVSLVASRGGLDDMPNTNEADLDQALASAQIPNIE